MFSFTKKKNPAAEVVINWHPHKIELVAQTTHTQSISAHVDLLPNPSVASLRQSLKTLYATCKLSPKSAVILCHHPKTLIRLMSLQARPGKQLTEQIAKKMGQYALFAGADIVSTHIIMSEEKTDGIPKQHTLVAAMPREAITDIVAACRLANLTISTLLPPVWAMMTALRHTISSGLVLLVEPNATRLFQVHHTQVHHLQTLSIGTNQGWQEVESTLRPHLDALIQRVTPTATALHIYSDNHEWRSPLLAITDALPTLWIETEGGGRAYAHYASHATSQNGNLMAALPLPQHKKLWIHFLSYITGVSVVLLLLFFVVYLLNHSVQKEITKVQHELQDMQTQYHQVTTITQSLSETKNLILGRRALLANRQVFDWQLYFRELPTMLTRSIRIERVNGHDDGHLYMEGKAVSSEDVFAFLKQLKNRSYLDKIQLQEVIQEKDSGMVRFSIKAKRTQL